MKKLIYISTFVFGLGFVSCQKQDVSPVGTDELILPTWENGDDAKSDANTRAVILSDDLNARGGSNNGEGEGGEPEGGGNESGANGDDDPPTNGNGGITDPNEDPDGSTKGKGSK